MPDFLDHGPTYSDHRYNLGFPNLRPLSLCARKGPRDLCANNTFRADTPYLKVSLAGLRFLVRYAHPCCSCARTTTNQICSKWCRTTEELSSSYWSGFIQHPWKGDPHVDHLTAGMAARLEVRTRTRPIPCVIPQDRTIWGLADHSLRSTRFCGAFPFRVQAARLGVIRAF